MKKNQTMDLWPLAVVILAVLGFVLRSWLYVAGVDAKGLLVRSHPLELGLWLCTAAAAAIAFLAARKGYKVSSYAANFSSSVVSGLGHILAGSGILLTVLLARPAQGNLLAKLWLYAGILCCPAMYWAAFDRVRGAKPFFGTYGVVSVFFALHLVVNYQSWCADPQLQNYVFSFFAALALMVLGYYQCAFCVERGSSLRQRFTSLMAVYCCVAAMASGTSMYLYGGCALWALTGMSRPLPRVEKKAGGSDASS